MGTIKMINTKFCLQWKEFETNMTTALKDLREEKDFFDVTIACEDNQIQAHKVMLSACSPYFRNTLRRNPHQHPLLYLKGVKYKDVLGILDFMYNGEVNVAQEELKQFLAVAADLKVKGLTQKLDLPPALHSKLTSTTPASPKAFEKSINVNENRPAKKRPCPTIAPKPTETLSLVTSTQQVEEDILEVVPVQPEVKAAPNCNITPNPKSRVRTPRKIKPHVTPATKILEQCIEEAEIIPAVQPKKTIQVVVEKSNPLMTVAPTMGKFFICYV